MVEKMQDDEKQPLKLSDKMLLAFAWVFVVYQFVVGCYHTYALIAGKVQSVGISLMTAFFAFSVVYLFQKNKDKVFLAKGYFVLLVFATMFFAVIFILTGSLVRQPTLDDWLVLLIMALGVIAIVYLYRKFFDSTVSIEWQVHKKMPPFRGTHRIKGNQHIIKIDPIDEDDNDDK